MSADHTNGDPGPAAIQTPRCGWTWHHGDEDHDHTCIVSYRHSSMHVCSCGQVAPV